MFSFKTLLLIFLLLTITIPSSIIQKIIRNFIIRFYKIPIYEVQYFQTNQPVGITTDEPVADLKHTIAFIFIPFIICTLICVLLPLPYFAIETWHITNTISCYTTVLLAWIGISTGLYALPDIEYIMNLDIQLEKNQINLLAFGFLKFMMVIFILISIVHPFIINSVYAVATANLLPWLLGYNK